MTDSIPDDSVYDVLAPLASGTYGENLVAVRREPFGLAKLFVLRQLRRSLSADEQVYNTFVDIGRRAARLSHVNVIQTYEIGERGGALYAATEYLDGEPVDAIITAVARVPGAVDPRLWLVIACEALNGLHYVHELKDFDGTPLNMLHGGVTPRKIFVTYSGRVVVADFGLAALAAHANRVEGTFLPEMVSYAAPEQRQGKPCDRRVDVYAVGLVLWELLAGKRHRMPIDPAASLLPMPPLASARPDIDPDLARVIAKAVSLDPGQRFASAADFRAALQPHATKGGMPSTRAMGEALHTLFAATRDKTPALLAKRLAPLAPLEPTAIGLVRSATPAEDEEAFLLEAPAAQVMVEDVLSVTELVSDADLESSRSLVSLSDIEEAPESVVAVSTRDFERDDTSEDPPDAKSLRDSAKLTPKVAPPSTPPKTPRSTEFKAAPKSDAPEGEAGEAVTVRRSAPASRVEPTLEKPPVVGQDKPAEDDDDGSNDVTQKPVKPITAPPDSGNRPTQSGSHAVAPDAKAAAEPDAEKTIDKRTPSVPAPDKGRKDSDAPRSRDSARPVWEEEGTDRSPPSKRKLEDSTDDVTRSERPSRRP